VKKRIIEFIHLMYRRHATLSCALIALFVLVADFITGPQIRFPMLYVIPAIMAAWLNKKSIAYAIAIVLPTVRLTFFLPWHQADSFSVLIINTLIRIAALVLIVYLVDRTAAQARRLKVLEGILSICASCKKIQNEKGDFEQMEKYISDHSQVLFSHGLCPECFKKLYPEYLPDEDGGN
jgi:hypothetical protein